MTDMDIPDMTNLNISERKAMSVWVASGNPVLNGNDAAYRKSLFLLPIDATAGDAQVRFIDNASVEDGKSYDFARIREALYIGWVWVDMPI